MSATKPKPKLRLLGRVLGLARPYRLRFIMAGLLAMLLAIATPAIPMLIKYTVDGYILQGDLHGVIVMTMVLIGVLLFEALCRYAFIFNTNWLGQSVIRNLRTRVFDHVIRLRMRYFDTTQIGTSTTRTINDVETINDIFSQGIIMIIADLLTMLIVLGCMLFLDWRLTLVTLAVFPLLLLATYVFKEKVKAAFQRVRTQVSRMNAFLQEHISGMKIVQLFTAEEREMKRFRVINNEYRKANISAIWSYSVFFPVVEILLATAMATMVWFGAGRVVSGHTDLGTLIVFFLYINLMFRPVRMLADRFNTVQMGLVAAERVFTLLDRHETIPDEGGLEAADIKGALEFRQVTFAYEEGRDVLHDVSFAIEPGETLAIVGATGSGKTSIINVLNRLYEIQQGQILVDGVDITTYDLYSFRSQIANVQQDVFLFAGSIYDNITMHNHNIPLERVVEAARACGVHRFITSLKGGYEYNVMERGASLSMGQRQLISMVRALVYDPAILVLDEATSSIDRESEMLIQQAIDTLIQNRTSIVVAHRLSTIRHAHRILVMRHGRVIESGGHEELLQRKGYYAKLYDMQFREQERA